MAWCPQVTFLVKICIVLESVPSLSEDPSHALTWRTSSNLPALSRTCGSLQLPERPSLKSRSMTPLGGSRLQPCLCGPLSLGLFLLKLSNAVIPAATTFSPLLLHILTLHISGLGFSLQLHSCPVATGWCVCAGRRPSAFACKGPLSDTKWILLSARSCQVHRVGRTV